MEQFRHLSIKWFRKSASDSKTVVKTVASEKLNTLSTLDKLVLMIVMLWCFTMLYWLLTPERRIDPIEYRDNISIEIENIA